LLTIVLEKSQIVEIKSWPQCCIIDVKLDGDSWNIPDYNAQVDLSLVTATDRSKKCSATQWAWKRKTQRRSDSLSEGLHWGILSAEEGKFRHAMWPDA